MSHPQYSQLGHRIFETFVLVTPTTMVCHCSHSAELLIYLGKAVRASCGGIAVRTSLGNDLRGHKIFFAALATVAKDSDFEGWTLPFLSDIGRERTSWPWKDFEVTCLLDSE